MENFGENFLEISNQKIMVNGEICTAGTVDERLNGKDTYSCSGSRVVFWKDNRFVDNDPNGLILIIS